MKNLTGATIDQYVLLNPLRVSTDFAFYEALEAPTGLRLIVEVILPGRQPSDDFETAFLETAHSLGQVSGACFPPILGFGCSPLGAYLALELDPDAWRPLQVGPVWSEREAARRCARIAGALDVLHQCKLVYGDLCPENVLVGTEDRVTLLNYGMLSLINREVLRWGPESLVGFGIGDVACFAPERICGRGTTPATDIYALGALYYTLVTGRRPFEAATPTEMALRVLLYPMNWSKAPPPKVRRRAQRLSKASKGVIARCMAARAENRYKTPSEVRKAFVYIAQKKSLLQVFSRREEVQEL